MIRKCKKCGVEKDLADFLTSSKCKFGKSHTCKACEKEQRINLAGGKSEYDRLRYERRKHLHKNEVAENNELYKMRSYKGSDKKKGRNNNLDIDFCIDMMNKPCYYCGHIDIPNNGLDRIDNSIGHEREIT